MIASFGTLLPIENEQRYESYGVCSELQQALYTLRSPGFGGKPAMPGITGGSMMKQGYKAIAVATAIVGTWAGSTAHAADLGGIVALI
jgi:hypothetical protein